MTYIPLCLNVLAIVVAGLVPCHEYQPLLRSFRLRRELSLPVLHRDFLHLFRRDLSSARIQNVRKCLLRRKGLGFVKPTRRPIHPFLRVGRRQQWQQKKSREIHSYQNRQSGRVGMRRCQTMLISCDVESRHENTYTTLAGIAAKPY